MGEKVYSNGEEIARNRRKIAAIAVIARHRRHRVSRCRQRRLSGRLPFSAIFGNSGDLGNLPMTAMTAMTRDLGDLAFQELCRLPQKQLQLVMVHPVAGLLDFDQAQVADGFHAGIFRRHRCKAFRAPEQERG